jgi:adenine-specific DNA-methyltransferase
MDKMTEEDGGSLNIVNENLEALKTIFPEAFTEEGVDFDTLRQLLGDEIDDGEEKYGLTWHGKKKARQIALTPSTGTLRPCPDESVDWDTTQNLFIEGDNLEVLKLLQKSYAGKVKMIYIDPPYNTGNEFIYPDKFQDNLETYLKYTGQKDDEGMKFSSNTESSGRKHTNWLNMMFPRLKLARNLLRQDGVIFISIDDNESTNLKTMCDELYGEENFIADIVAVNNLKGRNDKRYIATAHERLLIYCKSDEFDEYGLDLPEENVSSYKEEDEKGRFRLLELRKRGGPDTRKERPNMYYPFFVNPEDNSVSLEENDTHKIETYPMKSNGVEGRWRWGKETAQTRIDYVIAGTVQGRDGYNIYEKNYLGEGDDIRRIKPKSVMAGANYSTDSATKAYRSIMPEADFPNPKPVPFLEDLITYSVPPKEDNIFLDFFGGSATFAHAVMLKNSKDNGSRKFILVQLPEIIDEKNTAKINGFDTIAAISKERIRRAAKKIQEENPEYEGDLGFKVFKLVSSNIRAWNPDRSDLEQTLLDHTEHLVEGRSEQDLLYELLLKRGVDLTVPIEEKQISDKTVYSIGYGVLFACLDTAINRDEIENLGQGIIDWHKELEPASDTQIVFRDSAFADDIAKTNMTAILEQNGIAHVRSL